MDGNWNSRRSVVYGIHGICASSQPLATEIGTSILRSGGNAVDAAVAIAAALNCTEPCSTGIGGDAFLLWYDAANKTVKGINGSGRSPKNLELDYVHSLGTKGDYLPMDSIHAVTVPGAAALWCDAIEKFGSMKIADVLAPAINIAENGFPVHQCASHGWESRSDQLSSGPYGHELLIDGHAPKHGQIFKNPNLANTFRELAEHGKDGFYKGRIAQEIVDVHNLLGGKLSLEDLAEHQTTFVEPISVNYHGVDVYEIPPNGQGITALIALNILKNFPLQNYEHNKAEYLHVLIESLRLAFSDTMYYVTDPTKYNVPIEGLLSQAYGKQRSGLIDKHKAIVDVKTGSPFNSSDTVYFTVVDKRGNACSFINSNYAGFGSGIVPKGCGFTLQNRGANFALDPKHPNCLAPGKRPYHTIIPGMAIGKNEKGEKYVFASFGVMGGFMQPQGHVQVLLNMIHFHMNPQQALDSARFCIGAESTGDISVEQGIDETEIEKLRQMGHRIVGPLHGNERSLFGRGQIISINPETGVMSAGSDPRADGCAIAISYL